MINAEYYKTKEAAEKAYSRIGIVKKLFETSYTQGFVNWLYEDNLEFERTAMIKKFMKYFGVRDYEDIKESPWYRYDPKWLSECLHREAEINLPYDTACCDKMIISILKLLISEDRNCVKIGLKDADLMMNRYYTKEGHSEDPSLRNDYLRFIEMLSCFMSGNEKDLRYTEDRRHGEAVSGSTAIDESVKTSRLKKVYTVFSGETAMEDFDTMSKAEEAFFRFASQDYINLSVMERWV